MEKAKWLTPFNVPREDGKPLEKALSLMGEF